jgi:hypothetical protein
VFAVVVKVVEKSERIIPATVRLEMVNDYYRARVHELYFSATLGIFVPGHILGKRKGALLQNILSNGRAVGINELVAQVIQGTPEIPNNVPGGSERIHRDIVGIRHTVERGLSMLVGSNSVTVMSVEKSLHIDEVLLGPFNLGLNQN